MNIEHLRKQAKNLRDLYPRLVALHGDKLKLSTAQEAIARTHGYPSWRDVARDIAGGSGDRATGWATTLAWGSIDSLVQIMSSLIPSSKGDSAVFGERTLTMVTAVLYGLVDLRDGHHIDLDVHTLRSYLPLEQVEALAFDERLRTEASKNVLVAYLKSLPNWKPPSERSARDHAGATMLGPDGCQQLEPINEEAGRQHGFSQMFFTRALVLASLGD